MDLLSVQLRSIRYEALGVSAFEFAASDRSLLPAFSAGAHVDLHLAPGLVRSYSLCNDQEERHRYVIGVNRDRASRGGSIHVHDRLRVGDHLKISLPRNNFPLEEAATHSVLVAGGIGVTPLLAMARRLSALGRSWELHYCARSAESAGFLDCLRDLAARSSRGALHAHFDDRTAGLLDLGQVVASSPAGTHFYCCGPAPMLASFRAACAQVPAGQVHLEYFSAPEAPATTGRFEVELARSGRVLEVPEGKTVLQVMLDAGIDVPHSCQQGICGACETRVLAGTPDHRDLVLSPAEQATSATMMICCSGSRSPRLVLDC